MSFANKFPPFYPRFPARWLAVAVSNIRAPQQFPYLYIVYIIRMYVWSKGMHAWPSVKSKLDTHLYIQYLLYIYLDIYESTRPEVYSVYLKYIYNFDGHGHSIQWSVVCQYELRMLFVAPAIHISYTTEQPNHQSHDRLVYFQLTKWTDAILLISYCYFCCVSARLMR